MPEVTHRSAAALRRYAADRVLPADGAGLD